MGFEPTTFSMPLRRAPNCAMGPVDLAGFEPATSSVRLKRAPNCATGPRAGEMNSTRADLRLSSEQGRVGRSEGLGLPWKACERLGASACPLTVLPTRWPWFELGAFAGTRACMLACPQADLAGEDRHVGWRIKGLAPRISSPSRSVWSRSPRRSLPWRGNSDNSGRGSGSTRLCRRFGQGDGATTRGAESGGRRVSPVEPQGRRLDWRPNLARHRPLRPGIGARKPSAPLLRLGRDLRRGGLAALVGVDPDSPWGRLSTAPGRAPSRRSWGGGR